jgi:release factor glutamine methyltransferase
LKEKTFPQNLGQWLAESANMLAVRRDDFTHAEAMQAARLLAAKTISLTKTKILAHPETQLSQKDVGRLEEALRRLFQGEALPYVLGEWEFYGRLFTVTPDVLIPRPETELLIEQALEWAKAAKPRRIADVGSGSGIIGVTLALELPGARVTAVDVSPAALRVTQENARCHGVDARVDVLRADLLGLFTPGFDLICANLPYIPTARLAELDVARKEPLLALDGGADGLALIRRLVPQAARLLAPGGLALLEIDDTHGETALALARPYFPAAEVISDYQGKPRLLKLLHSI